MASRDTVQVYSPEGRWIADVGVTLQDGRYPKLLELEGRTFILEAGRYVETKAANGIRVQR